MTAEDRVRTNAAISFIIAVIIAYIIKAITNFNYNPLADGFLDFRMLISFLIFFISFIIIYVIFDKLIFKKS